MKPSEALPVPALLSLAWVAFTIEGDNLFEARMPHSTTRFAGRGGGPWLVSQAMWWTCMRFVDEVGIPVEDLERSARTFTLDYQRAAKLSLAIAANVLRLVDAQGCRLRDLPALSGVSAEAIAVAVGFLERTHLARVTSEGRTRMMTLTPAGLQARGAHASLLAQIEAQWRARFGEEAVAALMRVLQASVTGVLLARATAPPPSGWRAGVKTRGVLPWQPMVLHRGGFPDGA